LAPHLEVEFTQDNTMEKSEQKQKEEIFNSEDITMLLIEDITEDNHVNSVHSNYDFLELHLDIFGHHAHIPCHKVKHCYCHGDI